MILKPFMLRRIKQDVEHEMAPKVEVELPCPLSSLQRRLYQRLRNKITVEELLQSSTVHGGCGDTAKASSLMNLVMQFRKVRVAHSTSRMSHPTAAVCPSCRSATIPSCLSGRRSTPRSSSHLSHFGCQHCFTTAVRGVGV